MFKQLLVVIVAILYFTEHVNSQTNEVKVDVLKQSLELFPGDVVNVPVALENSSVEVLDINLNLSLPEGWKKIMGRDLIRLNSGERIIAIYSIRAGESASVGKYSLTVVATDKHSGKTIATSASVCKVLELEDISLQLVDAPEYVIAGKEIKASYELHNRGNTTKRIYLETFNCDVEGRREVELKPQESVPIQVVGLTDETITKTLRKYFTIKAVSQTKVYESAYHPFFVFPSGKYKVDIYHRFPITASATYLYSNQYDTPISGYQFEFSGNGTLDPDGKHHLEFVARGPDNNQFGYMGSYGQFYVSYKNKNLLLSVGERTYQFTPLTEASRYGLGTETRVTLNNGLRFGAVGVQPHFYEEIEHEIAAYLGYIHDRSNWVDLYYVLKEPSYSPEPVHLASIYGNLVPFRRTSLDFELSRGLYNEVWDNAYRVNLVSDFSVFRFSGSYVNAGENYPGYYNNSKFYSANFSASVTKWMNVGVYAKEDFQNAQLDTFYITAPYSKAFHSYVDFKVARQANLRIFGRDYERKDRLSEEKFHYKTQSLNAQFYHKNKSFDYSILGEYGKTANLQSGKISNKENTYLIGGDVLYRLNSLHSFRVFGNWSNINSVISDEERKLTYGFSANSRFGERLYAMLYLQNAYDLDDYYMNRNLLQFNLDYSFLKQHKISLRTYYTLFESETENPNLTLSIGYSCVLGVPTAKKMLAGSIVGVVGKENGSPVKGLRVNLLNQSAISDDNGFFVFNQLSPGRYLMFVDNSEFEMDEILNVKTPLEIEIVAGQKTEINLSIEKGARLKGQFIVADKTVKREGIVLELQNEFEKYRIGTAEDGTFSFPLVRQGSYSFKVYSSSLPSGYITEQTAFSLELKSGEIEDIALKLSKKQRKIRFSSQSFVLTPNASGKEINDKNRRDKEKKEKNISDAGSFYSVQIGCFSKRKTNDSKFFQYRKFESEAYIDGYYKYFIGKFTSIKEAGELKTELRKHYKGAFVVRVSKDSIIH